MIAFSQYHISFQFVIVIFVYVMYHFFFFFKQKTAYEMRISDWSSDVCSSDLAVDRDGDGEVLDLELVDRLHAEVGEAHHLRPLDRACHQIGGAADGHQIVGRDQYLECIRRVDEELGSKVVRVLIGDRKSTRLNSSH